MEILKRDKVFFNCNKNVRPSAVIFHGIMVDILFIYLNQGYELIKETISTPMSHQLKSSMSDLQRYHKTFFYLI